MLTLTVLTLTVLTLTALTLTPAALTPFCSVAHFAALTLAALTLAALTLTVLHHQCACSMLLQVDPARRILSKISAEDMCYVASVTRPPGSVCTVFSALMILVSPFEASGQDLEWPAVREWLETLGGVQPWLSNLWNFNMSLVPVTNALRAEEYLENQTVDEEGLFKFKPAVAHLLKWIHAVCATVGALTQREQPGAGAADERSAAQQQPQDQDQEDAASNDEQAQDEHNNTGEPESNTGEPVQAEQDSTSEQAQDEQNNIDEPEQAE